MCLAERTGPIQDILASKLIQTAIRLFSPYCFVSLTFRPVSSLIQDKIPHKIEPGSFISPQARLPVSETVSLTDSAVFCLTTKC